MTIVGSTYAVRSIFSQAWTDKQSIELVPHIAYYARCMQRQHTLAARQRKNVSLLEAASLGCSQRCIAETRHSVWQSRNKYKRQ